VVTAYPIQRGTFFGATLIEDNTSSSGRTGWKIGHHLTNQISYAFGSGEKDCNLINIQENRF